MLARLKFNIDSLTNTILDQIPNSALIEGQVLDLSIAGGQLIKEVEKRKLAAGLSKQAVKDTVYGIESNVLRRNYAVNHNKLLGTYLVVDILNEELGMKFDVVIGNPPYGDAADSGGALWEKFANLAFNKLVKPGGYVAMIHPPSWIGKHLKPGTGKSDYTVFKDNSILQLHVFDDAERKRHFPNAGTRVCWYLAQAMPANDKTLLVGYDKGSVYKTHIDLNAVNILPITVNDLSMSIHAKLMTAPKLDFIQRRELHYHNMKKKTQVSDTKSSDYLFKSYFSHKKIRYANFTFSDFNDIKVMVPQTSTVDNCFIDEACNVSEDLFYVKCKTWTDAEDIKAWMTSPLVSYIGRAYRQGRNLGLTLSSGIIPQANSNISLTAEELTYINEYR